MIPFSISTGIILLLKFKTLQLQIFAFMRSCSERNILTHAGCCWSIKQVQTTCFQIIFWTFPYLALQTSRELPLPKPKSRTGFSFSPLAWKKKSKQHSSCQKQQLSLSKNKFKIMFWNFIEWGGIWTINTYLFVCKRLKIIKIDPKRYIAKWTISPMRATFLKQ